MFEGTFQGSIIQYDKGFVTLLKTLKLVFSIKKGPDYYEVLTFKGIIYSVILFYHDNIKLRGSQ